MTDVSIWALDRNIAAMQDDLPDCKKMSCKIFLHIGMHETGSTAIQFAFNGYDDGRVLSAPLGSENHSIP